SQSTEGPQGRSDGRCEVVPGAGTTGSTRTARSRRTSTGRHGRHGEAGGGVSRTSVTVREAVLADAPFLAELWSEGLRRADHHERVADLETIIKAASASPDERLVVAEHDGRPAGAVLLRLGTVSPLNLEPTVQVLSPH